jgi:hypothetical protein
MFAVILNARLSFEIIGDGMNGYEKLKCNGCGKTLGYVSISIRTIPPKSLYRLFAGFPHQKVILDSLCEECFLRINSSGS